MNLRPYQIEARDAVLSEWQGGRARTLLVLPTGTGKTIGQAAQVHGADVRRREGRGELSGELVPGGGRLGTDAYEAAAIGAVSGGVLWHDHH